VPGIDTTSNHHDFILQIGSGNLSDYVVTHRVLIIETCIDTYFQLNRNIPGKKPDDAIVLLGGHDHLRDYKRFCDVPRMRPILKRRANRWGDNG